MNCFMRKIVLITLACLMLSSLTSKTQELNFEVKINSSQVGGTDQRAYESLEEAMVTFLNNRVWTNIKFEQQERLEGAIVVTIKSKDGNNYDAELNIALRRPTFKSSFNTPVFNYIDSDFAFTYIDYQPLDFSETSYTSNITSTLAYYAYLCLGIYFDTFGLYGGDDFYVAAEQIVTAAQSASESGWKAFDSNKNRYWLLESFTNAAYRPLRQYLYEYHRLGLDVMSSKVEDGRAAITNSLSYLKQVYSTKPNQMFLQILNDTKRDEWMNVYSEGPQQERTKAINILREIDASHATEYEDLLSSSGKK